VGLEPGPLSLVSTIDELLGRKSSGSSLEKRDYGRRGTSALTTWLIYIYIHTLEFTQPLTEMSTRSRKIMFLGEERGRCIMLTTLLPSVSRLS
jgi:hypothetical protein